MGRNQYWSIEQCRWEPVEPAAVHWSLQRCRWEPPGPAADALATPWSVFASRQPPAVEVPQQRRPRTAPAET
jgi:hypothetical protein